MSSDRGSWWSVTINNPTQLEYDKLKSPPSFVREMWYQTEIGEKCGTKHIQLCLNTTYQRFGSIKLWLGNPAHIELARNKDKLINYCRKSATSVAGSFVHWPDRPTNEIIEEEPAPELHEIISDMTSYITDTDISGNDFADVDEDFAKKLYKIIVRSAYRQGKDRDANRFFGRNVREAFIISWPVFYARHLCERQIELVQEEIAQLDNEPVPNECLICED